MPITVVCGCGKQFAVKDEVGGKRIKCPACAQAVDIPLPMRRPEPKEEPGPISSVFVPKEPARTEAAPPTPPKKRPFWKDPIVIAGAAGPMIVLAAFFGFLYHERQERAFRVQVAVSKALGDKLALSGEIVRAFDVYEGLDQLAQTRFTSDAQTVANIKSARAAMEKLREAASAERQRQLAILNEEANRALEEAAENAVKREFDRHMAVRATSTKRFSDSGSDRDREAMLRAQKESDDYLANGALPYSELTTQLADFFKDPPGLIVLSARRMRLKLGEQGIQLSARKIIEGAVFLRKRSLKRMREGNGGDFSRQPFQAFISQYEMWRIMDGLSHEDAIKKLDELEKF
jgi:hypothetical protein